MYLWRRRASKQAMPSREVMADCRERTTLYPMLHPRKKLAIKRLLYPNQPRNNAVECDKTTNSPSQRTTFLSKRKLRHTTKKHSPSCLPAPRPNQPIGLLKPRDKISPIDSYRPDACVCMCKRPHVCILWLLYRVVTPFHLHGYTACEGEM